MNARFQSQRQTARAKVAAQPNTNKWVGFGLVAAAAAFAAMFAGGEARAAQYPACNAVPVEFKIVRDFNWAERNTWQRGFEMVRLTKAHEHRTVQYSNSEVSRRYCMARAHFTNGHHRSIYYMISDVGGFVGHNWDVTVCAPGLDPWRNHGGSCRTMR